MSISYDLFTEAFLGKVTEFSLLNLGQYERDQMVDGYMKRACAQFNKVSDAPCWRSGRYR